MDFRIYPRQLMMELWVFIYEDGPFEDTYGLFKWITLLEWTCEC